MKEIPAIKVALADDHILLRSALAGLINSFDNCRVVCQANDGRELIELAQQEPHPDVILLDVSMPYMDGYDTAVWFQKNMPHINILMLTMYDSELLLIRLVQAGVRGFLKKDIHPSELKFAIQSVIENGYYYSNHTSSKLASLIRFSGKDQTLLQKVMLDDYEMLFLKLACTEMTYKEIALEMNLNPRAVDSLRDDLFEKLDVRSRVGLALYAIRKGIVTF
ncbi:MAG TPA: response regulator transcription factor [Chitinophagaceae bacterium]|nr:response regulator transcription factor [Chitinophagaceae bacterium]